jgi:hypothetical protein
LDAIIKEINLMASKFIIRITLTFLLVTLCLASLATPARAAAPMDALPVREHVIKFHLDPMLASDMEYARMVLPGYVSDMNAILEKNTSRRLIFNPETDIIITSTKPHTDSATPPMPTEGFEIWVHAVQTDRQTSHGGYAGMDISGAGVLAGLKWTRLYNPEQVDGTTIFDYSIQINNMLHELAHVFGAGIGEYYNLANITDTTDTAPLLNIKLNDAEDAFWSDKRDFMFDPLLKVARANTRSEYLQTVQYSSLTAAVISSDYRNGIPSLDHYTVQVLDANAQPISAANVKVWSVTNASELLFDVLTDENGQAVLAWGGVGDPHNTVNFLRLIKVYKDGASLTGPKYISIYDADMALLVAKSDSYKVTFQVAAPQVETPISNTAVFNSTGTQDGWISESTETSGVGGKVNNSATTFNLGDDAANKQYRAILHFDTSSLPDNAVITSATLKIKKQGVSGPNPFTTLGSLTVSMRQSSFGTPALAPADFKSAAGKNNISSFETTPANNWYSAFLNSTGSSHVNLMGSTQFRLAFETDDNNNNANNFMKFFSGNSSAANRPQLVIEYYVP